MVTVFSYSNEMVYAFCLAFLKMNIYLSVWTMDYVLFGVRLKFTRGVSTGTLLVGLKLRICLS